MTTSWKIAIHQGIGEVFTHWFRTLLTLVGIVMSVSALVGMVALNDGVARGKREASLQSGELTKIVIRSNRGRAGGTARGQFSRGLVLEDVKALRAGVRGITWIAPAINYDRERVVFENRISAGRVVSSTMSTAEANRLLPPTGRFINPLDVERAKRVCVLGGTVAKELFPRPADGVGKTIVIRGVAFRVVGVLPEHLSESVRRERERQMNAPALKPRSQSTAGGRGGGGRGGVRSNYDPYSYKNQVVYIPITTALATFNSANIGSNGIDQGPLLNISEIQLGFADDRSKEEVTEEARKTLLQAHGGVEDFEIEPPDASLAEVEQEIRSGRITGGVIAGISLLVGALGIINIMLASISDRTREIGVRRALGASARDIFRQVLVESTSVAIIGGILGIGGAALLLQVLESFSPPTNAPVLSWGIVVLGVLSASTIGVVAGFYPALKASAMSPTEALTSD